MRCLLLPSATNLFLSFVTDLFLVFVLVFGAGFTTGFAGFPGVTGVTGLAGVVGFLIGFQGLLW